MIRLAWALGVVACCDGDPPAEGSLRSDAGVAGTRDGGAAIPMCAVTDLVGLAAQQLSPTRVREVVAWTSLPGRSESLIATRSGRVLRVAEGVVDEDPALDLSSRVIGETDDGGELLAIAAHPGFAENGRLFVAFARGAPDGAFVVEEDRFDSSLRALPDAPRVVLTQSDREAGHPGGALVVGADGSLYVGLGDGGGLDDPHGTIGRAQDVASWLGKLLRLDVESVPTTAAEGNPWRLGGHERPEIWALGLRDPRAASFDSATGDLWILDTGLHDGAVFVAQPDDSGGSNYGWRSYDGFDVNDGDLAGAMDPHAPPAFVIPHAGPVEPAGDCRTIGGVVVRGSAAPELEGVAVLGQRCSSDVYVARLHGGHPIGPCRIAGVLDAGEGASVLALLAGGELVSATTTGRLLRLVHAPPTGTSWTRAMDDVIRPPPGTSPPRPIAPTSGARLGSSRAELRWELPAGADGARVELCRDRECAAIIATVDVFGDHVVTDVLPQGPLFWRLRRVDAGVAGAVGPTWALWPGRRETASSAVLRPVLDLDADGHADLLVGGDTASGGFDSVLWYRGGPAERRSVASGTLRTALVFGPTFGDGLTTASIGDVDGDGCVDAAALSTAAYDPFVAVHRGDPLGPDPEPVARYYPRVSAPGIRGGVAAGDFDGDGRSDLVIGAPYGGEIEPSSGLDPAGAAYFIRGGPSGPEPRPSVVIPSPSGLGTAFGARVAACDLNADGLADLVASTQEWSTTTLAYVFRGTPDGPELSPWIALETTGEPTHVGTVSCSGDVNGDGYPDVLVDTGARLEIFFGRRGGPPARAGMTLSDPVRPAFGYQWTVGDLNADGYDDIAVAQADEAGALEVHLGGASGPTSVPDAVYVDDRPDDFFGVNLTIGDLDGDGRDELVAGSRSRVLVVTLPSTGVLAVVEQIEPPFTAGLWGYGVAM